MKVTNKVVKYVVTEVAGEDVVPLVSTLKNKKNVSEFKLAEDINREINETRNMLYRLYHYNLVSFIRRKDKKKGWYIYYWTFNQKHVKFLVKSLKEKKLAKLRERLEREQHTDFYTCENSCMRLSFDQAVDFHYKCPECGVVMQLEENSKIIDKIEKDIKKIEDDLKKVKKKK